MMKNSSIFFVLVILFFLSSLFNSSYSVTWMKIEPEEVNVNPGGEIVIKISVGEEIRNQRVRLAILDKPSWLDYSLSIIEGKTPFSSNLTIRLSDSAPIGKHNITISLWIGRTLLEEQNVTLIISPVFIPPIISFLNHTCPYTVTVGEKIALDLSFNYTVFMETRIRARIFLNEQVETMIEFQLSGKGSIPLYRQLTAPSEPGELIVNSVIEYYDSVNQTWVNADLMICKVTVIPIPTILKIAAVGLPASVKVNVQILIIPQGSLIERTITSNREHKIDLSIYQPSTLLVIIEDEMIVSNNTKYVADNSLREIYVEPGWTVTLQFSYSPWYLVVKKVEPEDSILKILEGSEWVKRGESFSVSAPTIIESNNKRFTLSHIELNGEKLERVQTLRIDGPCLITYMYNDYNKLKVASQIKLPPTLAGETHLVEDLLNSVDEFSGEYWVRNGELFKIPFREYVLADYRFIPENFESDLEPNVENGSVNVIVNKPGFIKLYYNVEVKVRILLIHSEVETVIREEWVPLGLQYTVSLDELLSPKTIGEKIVLKSFKVGSEYKFLRDQERIILNVDSPKTIELSIDRYFLVRVHTIPSTDTDYPICIGPPGVTENSSEENIYEFWVMEKTPIVCYFPERIDKERESIIFVKGFAGDQVYTTPGLKSLYVEKPINISMEIRVLKYFELKGNTYRGTFLGGGLYLEGSRIIWTVQPQEYPADGLLGLLGFKWRAVNPFGIEEVHHDKTINITWVLTPSMDSPLLQFLQFTSIIVISYIASIYNKIWKSRQSSNRGDEDIGI